MTVSVHRAGLAIAALAAFVTVGGFFALDGYRSAQQSPSAATLSASSPAGPTAQPPDVVYVRPAPQPEVIHVTEPASQPPRKVVHVTVPSSGGEAGERDGGGLDD